MKTNLWTEKPHPIAGLAPMDGVTDAAFRHMVAKYGSPSVIFTEFTAAEGLRAGALILLDDFLYDPKDRPVVAQLFGSDPEAFYVGGFIAAALGFDGVDINMGCPAKNVTQRGSGAALIRDTERACAIVARTRQGCQDCVQGASIDTLPIPKRLITAIRERQEGLGNPAPLADMPVSVKTRIGYSDEEVETWIPALMKSSPDALSIHGRTFKQLYSGSADWEAIATAARIAHDFGAVVLGNGDVTSYEDGADRTATYKTDGFLIGRAAVGNPWIFKPDSSLKTITHKERSDIALEHSRYAAEIFPERGFLRIRKHLFEYTKSFPGAKEVRLQLSGIRDLKDVERIFSSPTLL